MRKLLLLLLGLTIAFGAAASVTITLPPAHADDIERGY